MARANGIVIDGPTVNNQWFTDGYGDYIRHFMTGLHAIPEWAPAGETHITGSSSVVKSVSYGPAGVDYITADDASTEVLRIAFVPSSVLADGQPLTQRSDLAQPGWTFDPTTNVLRVRHDNGTHIQIGSGGISPTPPALISLSVTPANPIVSIGSTQQFTATGTYADDSIRDLTSEVTWASSNTAVATIASGGLATGASAGSAIVSAALSGLTGNTTLTVTPATPATPATLAITTSSSPSATVGVAYSTTLAANGGTKPYAWTVTSGLPPGLTLNDATGAIVGTPTTSGTFLFTAKVTDSGNTVQSVNKLLSITVAAAAATPTNLTIWPSTAVPGLIDGGADSAVELGVKFRADVAGTITGIRFYKASTNTGTHVGNLWSSNGTLLATATFSNETVSGWQQVSFATPVTIAANTVYVASYHTNVGHYSLDVNYFAGTGVDNAPLHASDRRVGWQWCVCLRCDQCLPRPDLEDRQLLGGRRVQPGAVDGAGRAARHHHCVAVRRDGGGRLLGDLGGERWRPAVHLVNCNRGVARRPDLEFQHWGHQWDAHGGGYLELHGSGQGFEQSRGDAH